VIAYCIPAVFFAACFILILGLFISNSKNNYSDRYESLSLVTNYLDLDCLFLQIFVVGNIEFYMTPCKIDLHLIGTIEIYQLLFLLTA